MAKTLKEQQQYIGRQLGKARALLKRGPAEARGITQDDVDNLEAVYANLKMIETELAETPGEAKEAARSDEVLADEGEG